MGRLGIDLSGDLVILASVSPKASRLELRDFERLEANPDLFGLAEDLRRSRRQHRFPRRAEVVAWPGDPRVNAVNEAGFIVERVISPGEALERVARMHHGLSGIPGVTAVLSVDASGGALAIVRDGTVLQETALTWSSQGASDASDSDLLRRYSFLSELTETLGASFATVQRSASARVGEILTCGSLPDLRSLTMPLADEFDVEVETLDSTSEIDVKVKGRMPEEIADALPTLWVAMVASRRWHPKRHRPVRKLLKIAVPVGLAAAFAMMMFAGGEGTTGSKGPTASKSATGSAAVPRAAVPSAPPKPAATEVLRVQPAPVTPNRVAPRPTPPAVAEPLKVEPQRTDAARVVPPPAEPRRTVTPVPPAPEPAPQLRAVPTPPRPADTRAAEARAPEPRTPEPRATEPRAPQVPRVEPEPPQLTERRPNPSNSSNQLNQLNLSTLPRISLPLTSILWSPERQLVVADGQTLEVGDTISGMRIVRIEPESVIVRDRTGRLRRATLQKGPESMP